MASSNKIRKLDKERKECNLNTELFGAEDSDKEFYVNSDDEEDLTDIDNNKLVDRCSYEPGRKVFHFEKSLTTTSKL